MKINHLIIGAKNAEESVRFYCEVIGYERGESFVDTGTSKEGVILVRDQWPELLIVPFRDERLPSPQHIAFEVEEAKFDKIFLKCKEREIFIRAEPPLNSKKEGLGEIVQSGVRYSHFYICDPSQVNIEIMKPFS